MSAYSSNPQVTDHGDGIITVRGTTRTVEVYTESGYGAWRIVRSDAPADDFRQTQDAAIERALEVAG
jgi:hypothetical protein